MKVLGLITFTLFTLPLSEAGTTKSHRYVHYSKWKLSTEQRQVKHDIERIVHNHFVRHGVASADTIRSAQTYALNLIWRESNFRNVTNHYDQLKNGRVQTVHGYAQFRRETYQAMLKDFIARDGAHVPAFVKNHCATQWEAGPHALRCQVEVLSFAIRQQVQGSDRYVRQWGTHKLATTDTHLELSARLPGRAVAMSVQ